MVCYNDNPDNLCHPRQQSSTSRSAKCSYARLNHVYVPLFICEYTFLGGPTTRGDEGHKISAFGESFQEVLRQDQGREIRRPGLQQGHRAKSPGRKRTVIITQS